MGAFYCVVFLICILIGFLVLPTTAWFRRSWDVTDETYIYIYIICIKT